MPGLKDYEKDELPHCVYRMRAADGVVLYVGCSIRPLARFAQHGDVQPWAKEIASVTFEWFPDALTGRRAEAKAILEDRPKYNRLIVAEDAIGWRRQADLERKKRGDGKHCPRCGHLIENKRPEKAYCDACFRVYRQERRTKRRSLP